MPTDGCDDWRESARSLQSLLAAAVDASGETRRTIAARSGIHKDALRRILAGTRPVAICEAMAILDASGSAPRTALILALTGRADRAADWHRTEILDFIEAFVVAFPHAIEAVLGERMHEIRPRWAKGAAHRTARLLAEHVDQQERQDAQSFAV